AVRASGLNYVIMRPFNTYGRALTNMPKFVVDEAIHQALTQNKVHLRDPNPLRDFLFRDDHVNAYVKVVEAIESERTDIFGEAYEFGTGTAYSIADMAYMVASAAGVTDVKFAGSVRPGDIALLQG